MSTEPTTLPEALTAWMTAAGITSAELARTINVHPSAVAHWLRGVNTPAGERLADLAAALKLSRAESLQLVELAGVRLPESIGASP